MASFAMFIEASYGKSRVWEKHRSGHLPLDEQAQTV